MGQCYSHLSHEERTLVYWWLKEDLSLREMARRMNRSHTTLSREIRRNKWFAKQDYYPRGAQQTYQWRLQRRAQRFRLKCPDTRDFVIDRLKIGWTPEIISGRLKLDGNKLYICHESIYQFIYKEAPDLRKCLPRAHQNRRTKRPYRTTPCRIKNRVSVHNRPMNANERKCFGHWESDSIVSGCRKLGINVLAERKSRLAHISLMSDKTAITNHNLIVKRLKKYDSQTVRSITYDNGSENTLHEQTNRALKTKSYFCEPYHSWEKGSVEQINGLIRRFIPKGSELSEISPSFINRIEKLLNNRPRKCLNYQTPYEVFRKECGALSR